MTHPIIFAFMLTFLAGLASAIGGLVAFVIKKENLAALAVGLGFSAGVMTYVSFMELLPHSKNLLMQLYGPLGAWLAVGSFFVGTATAWAVDTFLPSLHVEEHSLDQSAKLKKTGLFMAFALALHNFPEGLATFLSAMDTTALGVSVALAVAIHNIPEGIAVSLPVYHASGKRMQAFLYSAASGMAEPIGGISGYFLLTYFLQEAALGWLFSFVAGIMVFLSLDELLPTAHDYGNAHQVIGGVLCGMAVMAITLLVF